MLSYIKDYHNALSPEKCDELIELFESQSQSHVSHAGHGVYDFTELNISRVNGQCDLALNQLEYLQRYINDCLIQPYQFELSHAYSFEEFRLKRYEPGQQFRLHTDEAANRVVACLYYLNDDFTGGYTSFPQQQIIVKPLKGMLVMFPSTWTYVHAGEPVLSGKKYILTSYLRRNETRT